MSLAAAGFAASTQASNELGWYWGGLALWAQLQQTVL